MTTVLVLGANGMLGHALCRAWQGRFEVHGTTRARVGLPPGVVEPAHLHGGIDATDAAAVVPALDALVQRLRPDAVVNAVGLIKQRAEAADARRTILVNAWFPHAAAAVCAEHGARFVHVSTDCVFTGARGGYTEAHPADADDVYGRSKRLGEPAPAPGSAVTLRMSLIGRELAGSHGLVEWFLQQARSGGSVPGFTHAHFSGLTTQAAAAVIGHVIERHPGLHGTWHVAAERIAKYDLLRGLATALGLAVEVAPRPEPVIDRSLDGSAFAGATGWEAPGWPEMLAGLAADSPWYDRWRGMADATQRGEGGSR